MLKPKPKRTWMVLCLAIAAASACAASMLNVFPLRRMSVTPCSVASSSTNGCTSAAVSSFSPRPSMLKTTTDAISLCMD